MRYQCRLDREKLNAKTVSELSAKFALNRDLTELLVGRGVDTKAKMQRFLHPSLADLHDPKLLPGLSEAAKRVKAAVAGGESVVIYGDYDADGICAAAILYLYLKEQGLEVNCYIPERENGYGVSAEAVEFIMEEFAPDLVITVDCGISNREEIAEFWELGSDVIVTDHHQIPESLPENAVLVNPWLDESYPFRSLCGAGVALKLVQALDPDSVPEYLDLAAIATVADSVPLLDENRAIVALGLAKLNECPRPCIAAYRRCAEKNDAFSAADLAFYLAPCVNAAGRYGKASYALSFLVAGEEAPAEEVCRELLAINRRRKEDCAEFTAAVCEKLSRRKQFTGRLIAAVDERIPAGIVGIVAARLVEIYRRPAFLFTKSDGLLKGSGRSIPGVNLFELLSSMKSLFTSFGGHAQAGGVSMPEENYRSFTRGAEEYLAGLDAAVFTPQSEYDFRLSESFLRLDFLREQRRLEPFGYGFPQPSFLYTSERTAIESSPKEAKYLHILTGMPGFSPMCFEGDVYADALESGFPVNLRVELGIRSFRERDYVSSQLRDVSAEFFPEALPEEMGQARYLEQLYFPTTGSSDTHNTMKKPEFLHSLDAALNSIYGTLVIANTRQGFEYFEKQLRPALTNAANLLNVDYVRPVSCRSQNTLLANAGANLDYAAFTEVFFLERPLNPCFVSGIVERFETNVTVLEDGPDTKAFLDGIRLDRGVFATYFRMLKAVNLEDYSALDYYRWFKIFKGLNFNIDLVQFIACMYVFNDLGIIRLEKKTGRLTLDTARSGSIENSKFYRRLAAEKSARKP